MYHGEGIEKSKRVIRMSQNNQNETGGGNMKDIIEKLMEYQYVGEFYNGLKHGKGKLKFTDDSFY